MAKHSKKAKLAHEVRGKKALKPVLKRPLHQTKPAETKKPEPTIPFTSEDRILLVGEGDFSFAKSIVEHHGCCDLTATCLDSKNDLFAKYLPQAEEHVNFLEQEGQTVLYDMDATKLDQYKNLQKAGRRFDVVIFNFPHVGGKSKDVNRQVRFNQELLVSFFKSAISLLAPNGTIVVTLFEGEPYTLWNLRDLARHSGLEVRRSFRFLAEAFPGYAHARTLGNINGGGGWKGEEREARSFVLAVKGADVGAGAEEVPLRQRLLNVQKKRKAGESSSEED